MLRLGFATAISCLLIGSMAQTAQAEWATPDPALDAEVQACFEQDGVGFLPDSDVICYNAAIFPEEFLQLNDLEPASRIIITSPGGNVATARGMSTILDNRAESVVIAGPCMSACAMVILPGLDEVYIHRTAHIAVHGITMIPFGRWYGWLKDDEEPGSVATLIAQSGYNLDFALHGSGTTHMRAHLEGQGIDVGYIMDVSDAMEADARAFTSCRVDVKDYWGILNAEHLQTYLGDHLTGMEPFVQSWSDPANAAYLEWGHPISDMTYIMNRSFGEAECSEVSASE
ncbi:MAG: hypothetical protein CBB65_00825 [Hyphomonadaceae bacterium TMED5]|nr:hypothetical protein [Ponticaulis sp.]OUY01691.1 MAG: hypothetical protein CBB65_00825 [Hyphomonadaceae bacterium TMED5]